ARAWTRASEPSVCAVRMASADMVTASAAMSARAMTPAEAGPRVPKAMTKARSPRTTISTRKTTRTSPPYSRSPRKGGGGGTEEPADAIDDVARAEWLEDVVGGAGVDRAEHALRLLEAREHDDRDRAGELAQQLEALAVGEVEIEDHEVRHAAREVRTRRR